MEGHRTGGTPRRVRTQLQGLEPTGLVEREEPRLRPASPVGGLEQPRVPVRRLEIEGIRELVSIRFCGGPESTEIGAILTFSDRERMIWHMNMVSSWGEFKRFFGTVRPLDVRVYGRLSDEAEDWVRQFGDIVSKKFEGHVAGFVR